MNIQEKIKLFKYLAKHYDSMDYPPIILWRSLGRERIKEGWEKRVKEILKGEIDCPGLYVHIPYCQTKCFFCKFRVRAGNSSQLHSRYLRSLKAEIHDISPLVKKLSFRTLYLGGGTPTIFSDEQLEDLLSTLEKRFNLKETTQRLIESTPATLSMKKFRILKKYGFNRITIGVQVTDKKILTAINRRNQTRDMVKECFGQARKAGIEIINIDLVAGLPGQSTESFLHDVRFILKMRPDALHLFPYEEEELVIFYRIGKKLTDQDRARRDKMLEQADHEILKHGYRSYTNEPYLLSPQAANFQFQYRYCYNGSLLGLGAEALSYIPNHYVYENAKLEEYLACWSRGKSPRHCNGYPINRDETRLNYILNNIRHGLNKNIFFRLYGLDFHKTYREETEALKKLNRLEDDAEKIKLIAGDDAEFRAYSKFFFSPGIIKELNGKIKKTCRRR